MKISAKKKERKKGAPEAKALTRPLNESEKQLCESFAERDRRAKELPVFKERTPTTPGLSGDQDTAVSWERICSLLKIDHRQTAAMVMSTTASVGILAKAPDFSLDWVLQQFAALKPQSYIETMLIAQMIQVSNAASVCMTRAFQEGQTTYGKELNANLAIKFQRTFIAQIEALQRLRGKGGQKVTVEHVHVHQGGQAIVGNVEKGEGKNGK